MQQCNSLLVMLELLFHISFFVTALIVFVYHCCQRNCGVVWRTQLSLQPPSPLSGSLTFLLSQLARVNFPLLRYVPLCVIVSYSQWLLSGSCCTIKTERLLFYFSSWLRDLLENSFPLLFCRHTIPKLCQVSLSITSGCSFKRIDPFHPLHSSLPFPSPSHLPSDPHLFVLKPHPFSPICP
ncbi:hypothetical protein XENOCAPTIV_013430 [Xenoophorus captivus]|uniref:Uncharacterized protein n=1 Tax=Xenoophorus captivus TaxID=1517983 RepID=A0ABV0R8J1_9TELE